ncbi:MAG: hypothetical protein ACOC0R_06420, partial [Mariniphaga sp.]
DKRMKVARFPNNGNARGASVEGSNKFTSSDLSSGMDYTGSSWFGRIGYYHTPAHRIVTAFAGK